MIYTTRKALLLFAVPSVFVTFATLLLFFVSDQALEALRTAVRLADLWIEADRNALLQVDRCINVGGTECDLVETSLKRPLAYFRATRERAKSNPDDQVIREALAEAGTDISPRRFRLRWFDRISAIIGMNFRANDLNSRTKGKLPLDIQIILDLNKRAKEEHAKPAPDAAVLASLRNQILAFRSGINMQKAQFDSKASQVSARLRRMLYLIVVSCVVGMFGVATWVSQGMLRAWAAEEHVLHEREVQLSRELAQRVAQLQVTLREKQEQMEQLHSTTAALQRSNRDLQQFAYAASHDLQEPLRNMALLGQLLAKQLGDKLDIFSEGYLVEITANAKRMKGLISSLLTYTRAADPGEELAQDVDMNAALKLALDNLKNAIEESKARINFEDLPPVRASSPHMVEVFQNIIDNSLKYRRPEVIPEIYISAQSAGSRMLFTVRDNGQGFMNDYSEKIFGIFKRLSVNTPGSGIGLSVCKAIIDRYGGEIWATSEPNCGAEISFTLPGAK